MRTLSAAQRSAIEVLTQSIGQQLFAGLKETKPQIWQRRWWDDRLMAWSMKDEDLKVQLFRFVDVLPAGSTPETRSVRASNTARIAVHRPQPDTVMVLVVEDNLTKGASGQAVQCMNLMCGLPEHLGLTQVPVLP